MFLRHVATTQEREQLRSYRLCRAYGVPRDIPRLAKRALAMQRLSSPPVLLCIVACTCLLYASWLPTAHGATIEVKLGTNVSSLAQAGKLAKPGDTILIRGGVYTEKQRVLNLQGAASGGSGE